MSIADYIILAAVAVCLILALCRIFKRRKNPCSGCTGDCTNCTSNMPPHNSHKKGRK